MKKIPWIGLFVLAALFGSAGTAAAESADADWAALQGASLVPFQSPEDAAGWSGARLVRDEQRRQQLRGQGLAFYESHPTDPRRWTAVWWMLNRRPRFIASYGPDFEKNPNDVAADPAAMAAWKIRLGEMRTAMATATDVPVEVRELFEARTISEAISRAIGPGADLPVVDWATLLSAISAFDSNFPQSRKTVELLQQCMEYYERSNTPAESAAVWQRFAASPNQPLTERARERLRLYALVLHPLELQFTAADGRVVDLAQLRGKVVLVDFWATWCSPCLEEIPNVLANYRKYHDRGFEVVGITLENAQLTPADTPEQQAAKLAKCRKAMLDFAATHELSWPQYFDGKFWQNEIFTKYAINSLPAMLLLDQEGKLVSTDARGVALEREVKRLLKL